MRKLNRLYKIRDLVDEAIEEEQGNLPGPSPSLPPEDEWEFKNCNLWKPVDHHGRSLVVLLRGDWAEPDKVQVLRKNGEWENMIYTGLSNFCGPEQKDRHTYRGSEPGGPAYAGKRQGGGVRVWYGEDFAFIPLPGKPKDRHE